MSPRLLSVHQPGLEDFLRKIQPRDGNLSANHSRLVDVSAKAARIDFRAIGSEKGIDAGGAELGEVGFEAARVLCEILFWSELSGIHKDGGDDGIAVLPRAMNQRKVAFVQRPHCGHEADNTPFGARLTRGLLHPGDSANGFQCERNRASHAPAAMARSR